MAHITLSVQSENPLTIRASIDGPEYVDRVYVGTLSYPETGMLNKELATNYVRAARRMSQKV